MYPVQGDTVTYKYIYMYINMYVCVCVDTVCRSGTGKLLRRLVYSVRIYIYIYYYCIYYDSEFINIIFCFEIFSIVIIANRCYTRARVQSVICYVYLRSNSRRRCTRRIITRIIC